MGPHEHEDEDADRTDRESRRDHLLLGGSAGALDVLERILSELPADLSAAVLVCLHRAPGSGSALEHVLARAGPLPVERAPAVEADAVDRVVAVDEAAADLLGLTASTAPPPPGVPEDLRREVQMQGEAVAEPA